MLTILLIFVPLLLILYLCGVATRQNLRKQVTNLRLLLAQVTGERDKLAELYDHMHELAKEALEVAKERHFPASTKYGDVNVPVPRDYAGRVARFEDCSPDPDPDPYSVAYCARCSVCVRSATWPTPCPNCGTTIDPVLDSDLVE